MFRIFIFDTVRESVSSYKLLVYVLFIISFVIVMCV